ncbi:hypothetical protein Tco_1436557 [Tanacetum coccineum]
MLLSPPYNNQSEDSSLRTDSDTWNNRSLESMEAAVGEVMRKDIKVKKSKNKPRPTRNEETSDQERDLRKDIKAGSA